MRHKAVPRRPREHDGDLVVLVSKEGGLYGPAAEAELRSRLVGALGDAAGHELESVRWEKKESHDQPRDREPDMRWRVRFASHAAAEAAVAAGEAARVAGVSAIFAFYNERPYDERGWTVRARAAPLPHARRRRVPLRRRRVARACAR